MSKWSLPDAATGDDPNFSHTLPSEVIEQMSDPAAAFVLSALVDEDVTASALDTLPDGTCATPCNALPNVIPTVAMMCGLLCVIAGMSDPLR